MAGVDRSFTSDKFPVSKLIPNFVAHQYVGLYGVTLLVSDVILLLSDSAQNYWSRKKEI